jgi:glucose-induced degradation protein 8
MSYNDRESSKDWEDRLKDFYIKQDDLNRLIMDYLVNGKNRLLSNIFANSCPAYRLPAISEGFKEAAEKFQEESGIEPDVDLSSLDNRIQIREAVQTGRIEESISLVNQLHPELLDNDRYLYFHLQQLHLIELIR